MQDLVQSIIKKSINIDKTIIMKNFDILNSVSIKALCEKIVGVEYIYLSFVLNENENKLFFIKFFQKKKMKINF